MEEDLKRKYWELTQKIIECAMNVHKSIGPGFKEYIYRNAMAVEMSFNSMDHDEEIVFKVFHRQVLVGSRRADSVVASVIILEYKARRDLDDDDLCQGINNLEASGYEVGLLFNFWSRKLQFRRLFNNRTKREPL
jgi:GxxExxY protein